MIGRLAELNAGSVLANRNRALKRAINEAFQGLEDRKLFNAYGHFELEGTTLTVYGTTGADTIVVNQDAGAQGDKYVTVNGVNTPKFKWNEVFTFLVDAGAGDDRISVSNNVQSTVQLLGGKGNDRINTGKGAALGVGGAGRDTLVAGSGDAQLFGGANPDRIVGGSGQNFINGGGGNDTLVAGPAKDTLYGGPANDTLYAKPTDRVEPGAGQNTVVPMTSGTGGSTGNTGGNSGGNSGGSSGNNSGGNSGGGSNVDPTPTESPRITSLSIVDAATGQVIPGYANVAVGSTLNLVRSATLPQNINVVANTSGGVTQVRFNFNGVLDNTDTAAPFNAATDTGSVRGFTSDDGTYRITATPFKGATAGSAISLTLNIKPGSTNSGGGSNSGGQNGNTNQPGAPTVKFDLSAATVTAGAALHVDGTDTAVTGADIEDASFEWNFGDSGAKYNTMRGFNSAHVYANPGTYTVKLTVTDAQGRTATTSKQVTVRPADAGKVIYVGGSQASDDNDGQAGERALKSLAAAMSIATDDTTILLAAGQTYDVSAPLTITQDRVTISTWGSGARPVLRFTGPDAAGRSILTIAKSAQQVTVDGVAFDTKNGGSILGKTGIAGALSVAGTDVLIRDCAFFNVLEAVNSNGKATRLMMMDNVAPLEGGIRAYFLWSAGSDHVLVGNDVANSTREHIVRVWGTDRIAIQNNHFVNLDRRAGTGNGADSMDTAKSVINVQVGTHAYVSLNDLVGPWRFGPLGGVDGLPTKDNRFEHVRIEDNVGRDGSLQLDHGLEHATVVGNRITNDNDSIIQVDGSNLEFGRVALDLVIDSNIGFNDSTRGRFLNVLSRASGITLTHNTYVAPNLAPGSFGTAAVYVDDKDLRSFTRISQNVWPDTDDNTSTTANAMFWVNGGYVSRSSWNAEDEVGEDQFRDTTRLQIPAMTEDYGLLAA
jgi:PKD repeat protein